MEPPNPPCPGCADGTPLGTWPLRSESPYRPAPEHPVRVQACKTCGGVWVDRATLQGLIDDAARTAAVAPPRQVQRKTLPPGTATAKIVYRHCPQCKNPMLRKNFGSISGIIVDLCAAHGTFFEYGELPGVVEFVRSGGLALSQRHAAAENARDAKHKFAMASMPSVRMGPAYLEGDHHDAASDAFVHWATSWVRNMFR